jgi:hypothetical protein
MPSRISAELAQLARLARNGGLDLSQVSLRVKADLLMSTPQPPAEDIAAFSELATALIPTIDEATSITLARKLAGWPLAPAPVLQALKARGGEVLVALLRHGMALTPAELEAIAAHGGEAAALALAERTDLPSAASLMLTERGERTLDLALIANPATLPRTALDLLLARARSDAAYAPGLLARRDLSDAELIPLFLQAGTERRLAMLESLSAIEALGQSERRSAPDTETFDGWLLTAGEDRDGVFGVIASYLGGGTGLAEAMAQDRSRDLIALAMIAAGVSVEDATRLLIRLSDETARSVERIFALVALMRSVSPAVAYRLVMQVAGESVQPATRRSQHQPAMDPSGTPTRQGATKPEGRALFDEVRRALMGRREQG